MRRLLPLLLGPTLAHAFDPPPGDPPLVDPTVLLRAETILDATRWRGARAAALERTDVRQRLGLEGRASSTWPDLWLSIDLEVGSDFGPEGDAFQAMPGARRVVVDLYAARLDLRTPMLDATLGRHLLYDVLGMDALDGLTLRLRPAPFLSLEASGGLASRRGWSSFGPDVFEPDGTALADEPGWLLRGLLATRRLAWVALRGGWSRQFDAHTTAEQVGGEGRFGPEILHIYGHLRYSVATTEWETRAVGLGTAGADHQVRLGWRSHRPVFSTASIWNAFHRSAGSAWELAGSGRWGELEVGADASVRVWPAGPEAVQTPALPMRPASPTLSDELGVDLGARARHAVGPGQVGVEGRLADGHGGPRQYGEVFGSVPWRTTAGREAVRLRARLGALRAADLNEDATLGGFGLLAAEWRPEETIRLEALGELFAGEADPARLRVMLRLTMEDGW